jgi:hypothetical protein
MGGPPLRDTRYNRDVIRMKTPRSLRWTATSIAAVALAGCTAARPDGAAAVAAPVEARITSDVVEGTHGARVELPHYVIHTTIPDPSALRRIGLVLEGAQDAYRSLAPEIASDARPLECYIFETRGQWASYTRAHTGDDAAIYLRVNRGGYTVNDKFVAYWIGEAGTLSVAAHEGWHQYVARHLKGRLPPFLEEGLACMFEQVEWAEPGKNMEPSPRFDVRKNYARQSALRVAADTDELYPLKTLVTMHAGQVVGKRSVKIEAFYAESWAFARFLRERHPGALRRMLVEASHGVLFADNSRDDGVGGPLWDPSTARPMIEHYLGENLGEVEIEFSRFVREIAE